MNSEDLTILIEELTTEQLAGLLSLVSLSQAENTTIQYQCEQWGFDEINEETIYRLKNENLFKLIEELSTYLLTDLITQSQLRKQPAYILSELGM